MLNEDTPLFTYDSSKYNKLLYGSIFTIISIFIATVMYGIFEVHIFDKDNASVCSSTIVFILFYGVLLSIYIMNGICYYRTYITLKLFINNIRGVIITLSSISIAYSLFIFVTLHDAIMILCVIAILYLYYFIILSDYF